jgi:hypothetical protein
VFYVSLGPLLNPAANNWCANIVPLIPLTVPPLIFTEFVTNICVFVDENILFGPPTPTVPATICPVCAFEPPPAIFLDRYVLIAFCVGTIVSLFAVKNESVLN